MTDREKLIELAQRCEKAEGLDRELDAGIAMEVYLRREGMCIGLSEKDALKTLPSLTDNRYTASIDAAMTLIGGHRLRGFGEREDGSWSAGLVSREHHGHVGVATAATGPLAICAAALRALAGGG